MRTPSTRTATPTCVHKHSNKAGLQKKSAYADFNSDSWTQIETHKASDYFATAFIFRQFLKCISDVTVICHQLESVAIHHHISSQSQCYTYDISL